MDLICCSHDGIPEAKHFSLAIIFAFALVPARFLSYTFLYQRLAIWLVSDGMIPLKVTKSKKAIIAKCSESMWKLTHYVPAQAWVISILYQESWAVGTNEYFEGWPNQELKLPFTLVYMCQCGFYLYSITALLTWETRRKDFAVMMTHHFITVLLLGFSYFTRYSAKVFKYSNNELGASVFFGFFSISWFTLRLVYFPFWVIKSTSYDLIEVLKRSEGDHTFLYYFVNSMLLTLLTFHIYWWMLICSMITRQLRNKGKVGEDVRSDSDDDD
ncbi:hypothetical protein MKW98_005309 [Papaver atlanticum]|uniref:TLC domain-containing protein n=1 Tax=Papaver atlanticum TaxID=357466 RepID=A0AAD4X503_9MAGN|nr:hypothetical protein MKW98_005309 [Papaver atlanticum]